MRLLFFVPLVAYWCATSLVLTQLLCCSRATKTMQTKQQVRFQAAKRLSRFAAVFALCWVGQAMGRVGEAVVGQHQTPTWLEYLESFGNTAVGLLNGISWGLMLRRQVTQPSGSSAPDVLPLTSKALCVNPLWFAALHPISPGTHEA